MVKFKPYTQKSSLLKYNSRYLQGGKAYQVGSKIGWWERYPLAVDPDAADITIDSVLAGRPDILAYQLYGTSKLEWVILQYNNIVDIQESFSVGSIIKAPSSAYVFATILTRSGE